MGLSEENGVGNRAPDNLIEGYVLSNMFQKKPIFVMKKE
jgi:hypothetical protein